MHRWTFPGALILADAQMAYVRFGPKWVRAGSMPIRTLEELARAKSAATKLLGRVEERSEVICALGDAWERHIDEACAAMEARQTTEVMTEDASDPQAHKTMEP